MTYDKVKYNAQYNKENYAEIKLRIPKDSKQKIEKHYKAKGFTSMNGYITSLINADMQTQKEPTE